MFFIFVFYVNCGCEWIWCFDGYYFYVVNFLDFVFGVFDFGFFYVVNVEVVLVVFVDGIVEVGDDVVGVCLLFFECELMGIDEFVRVYYV